MCLHTVLLFPVPVDIINNFQTNLYDPEMGPKRYLLFQFRVNFGETSMNGQFIISQIPEPEPHHRIQINLIPRTSLLFLFTHPLRSGRIWHKVNFLSGV